jgi:hypothetical protein
MTATTTAKIAAKKIVCERLLRTFLPSDIAFIDATDAEFCSPVTGGHRRRGVFGSGEEEFGCPRSGPHAQNISVYTISLVNVSDSRDRAAASNSCRKKVERTGRRWRSACSLNWRKLHWQ